MLIIYSLFTSSPRDTYLSNSQSLEKDENGYYKKPAAGAEASISPLYDSDDDIKNVSFKLKIPVQIIKNTTEKIIHVKEELPEKIEIKPVDIKKPDEEKKQEEIIPAKAEPPINIETKQDDLKKTDVDNKTEEAQKEKPVPEKTEPEVYSAVFYEDHSNLLNYESRSSIIDSTLKEYKKIKRIGRGTFELKKNCICFNAEKKSYRYDFHRISKIKGGDNYAALFIKMSKTARLFIFDNDSAIGIKIEQFFNDESRSAG